MSRAVLEVTESAGEKEKDAATRRRGDAATTLPRVPASPRPRVWALRIVQLGALVVILVVSTLTAFELDRFFVPKELALHLTAVLAGLFALRAISRAAFSWVDLLLLGFLILGVLSAAIASNRWLAVRALAISASGVAIFWAARGLRAGGLARPLLGALALAVILTAITSLLQTYGVESTLFSENRAPGGTLGNRNFVAHVAAFGFPVVLVAALAARRTGTFFLVSLGIAIVAAALTLTRSRAAWIAFAAVLFFFVVAIVACAPLRRDGRIWMRLGLSIISAGCGVAAALIIPNTLRWRSDNPYLESIQRVADYQQGSGRGRLVQYEQTLRMAARYPLLGVGPGNWAVGYPAHAARGDPSLNDSEPGMTFNPWPSSDWVAAAAERGFPAAVLMALVFFGIAAGGVRQLFGAVDVEQGLFAAALLSTVAGSVLTGLFDAVLLLAVPTLLVWATLGVLWVPASARQFHKIVVIAVIIFAALGTVRSAVQLVAMDLYSAGSSRGSLSRAAQIDPGNYRLHLRLARSGRRADRCKHARAAHALYPHAQAAIDLSRACGN